MFGYELLRNQWVMVAFFGGLALVAYFILHFRDYHRPRKRKKDHPEEYEHNYMNAWQAIPWSMKVTVALIMTFGVIYSIFAIIYPNSW